MTPRCCSFSNEKNKLAWSMFNGVESGQTIKKVTEETPLVINFDLLVKTNNKHRIDVSMLLSLGVR